MSSVQNLNLLTLQVKPARGSGTGMAGIHSVLLAQCEKCNETITSAPSSEITVPDSVSVTNIRTVASLVAPLPSSEQTNLLSSNHTYTKSTPKHIHHHYAPSVTSTHHDTHHLFNCTHIRTTLSPQDLWTDPAGVTALLARWTEKLAGGPQAGTSDSPPLARAMGVGRQQQP